MKRNTRKKGKKTVKKNRARGEQILLMTSPGSLRTNLAIAPSIVVNLKYQDPTWMYGNNGGFVWSTRFRMNSAYDPDPHALSGSMAYFAEYANMYTRYRVIQFKYSITCSNQMTEPVIFTVAPSKEDLGDNFANILEVAELNGGRTALLGSGGSMNRASLSGTINLSTYSGSPSYMVDDIFSARVNTDPVNLTYINIGCAANILQQANSFGVRSFFTYRIIFYQPKTESVLSKIDARACPPQGGGQRREVVRK